MAPILGPRALIDIAIPTGVDSGEVFRFAMENGMTGQEAVAMAATAIGRVNDEMIARYGGLLYVTESNFARTRQGETTRTMTPKHAEFAINDPIRSDQIGHMLPRDDYSDSLAWSQKFLQRADRELLRFDLDLIVERWRNRVDYDLWLRMLTNTENVIGTAGYDVPWAIGTGTNVNYIPPQWRGYIFASTHTHFKFADDDTLGWNDLFDDMIQELRHHGHSGSIVLYVSDADVEEVLVATNVSKLEANNVVIVGGNTSSPVRYSRGEIQGIPGELIGYYNSARGQAEIRYHERIPTNYAFGTKSYGVNNPQNGLALRAEPGVGFGLKVVPQLDKTPERRLDYLLFDATHGVGVWDRTNGVAGYLNAAAASYVNPTIA